MLLRDHRSSLECFEDTVVILLVAVELLDLLPCFPVFILEILDVLFHGPQEVASLIFILSLFTTSASIFPHDLHFNRLRLALALCLLVLCHVLLRRLGQLERHSLRENLVFAEEVVQPQDRLDCCLEQIGQLDEAVTFLNFIRYLLHFRHCHLLLSGPTHRIIFLFNETEVVDFFHDIVYIALVF